MTPTTLALSALAHIQPSNGTLNTATIALASNRQLQWIADDLTATLQDIYKAAKILYRRSLGALLPAPETISVDVTNGSATFTTGGTVVDGATLVIEGDATFNRVRNENGAKLLLYPYQGTTGTHSATIYGDSILLDSTVGKVLGNVYLADRVRLEKAVNRNDLYQAWKQYPDYGRRYGQRQQAVMSKPTIGQPTRYFTEPVLLTGATGHVSKLLLRVNPLPSQAYAISYDVKLRAPRITVADIGTDNSESTVNLVVPEDEHESLLRPLFLLKWSASPWFKDEEAKRSIKEQAAAAMARLDEYRAQQESNRTLSVRD